MALELKQQMKLSQQLLMTPQLQQAIKLLQLSRIELVETVQRELLENPLLEEIQDDAEYVERSDSPEAVKTAGEEAYDNELSRSGDWEDYLGDLSSTPRLSNSREYELSEEISSLEARHTTRPTLDAHLSWQLRLSSLTEAQKDIGEIILGNIDSSGYLAATLEEIAGMAECSVEEANVVLEAVQHFDPLGVASRNPQECLMVQIKALKYDRDPILVELVTQHLDDLENHRYKPLLRKFHIDMEILKEYIDIIQSLEPMPGASFGDGDPMFISPDVYVYQIDGDFVILLNDDGLPQLRVSDLYTDIAQAASSSQAGQTSPGCQGALSADKEYIAEKYRAATWLIKSLHQRQSTLYKVMESIVRHQRAFFEEGVGKLKPLILKEIAEDISMHESTVSRITTNKFVATAHGLFEIKFFFNSALGLDDGSQVGSESVKALLKKHISAEDPKNPLSDEKLCDILKEELGVAIARRTVAKYRTALDIPSSSHRKTHF